MSHIKIVCPSQSEEGSEFRPTLSTSADPRPDSEKIRVTFVGDDGSEHDLAWLIFEVDAITRLDEPRKVERTYNLSGELDELVRSSI